MCGQRCQTEQQQVQLRRQEVPFIGHVATDKGLWPDPIKVDAITRMPLPTDYNLEEEATI